MAPESEQFVSHEIDCWTEFGNTEHLYDDGRTEANLPSTMHAVQHHGKKGEISGNMRSIPSAPIPFLHSRGVVLIRVMYASINPIEPTVADSLVLCQLVLGSPPVTLGTAFVGWVAISTLSGIDPRQIVF